MEIALCSIAVLFIVNGLALVSCIASNASPQPLSKEEELAYLKLLQQGDEKAFNILAERNYQLVNQVIKKHRGEHDEEELISAGTVGLIKALKSYRPSDDISLAAYIEQFIACEVETTLQAKKLRDCLKNEPDSSQQPRRYLQL